MVKQPRNNDGGMEKFISGKTAPSLQSCKYYTG